jgi:hypothetical protein
MREFVNNNDLIENSVDPSKQYQKTIRNTVNKCITAIPKDKKWKVNCLNPNPPKITGFIKLHKTGNPIRPVINFQYAPAYKVAQFFTEFFNNTFQLPYTFNVRNSVELVTDLNKIKKHGYQNMLL